MVVIFFSCSSMKDAADIAADIAAAVGVDIAAHFADIFVADIAVGGIAGVEVAAADCCEDL